MNVSGADLSVPTGKVILNVSGQIQHMNDEASAVFDREMLVSLPQKTVTVETPWTEGQVTFTGPVMRDVFSKIGANGTSIDAIALNDYKITIPMSDVETYDVIFALQQDGKKLSIRDKGPIWVIYPWGDYEELRVEKYFTRSIWQLKTIVVK